MDTDALVRDYLGRLEAAAWPLAATRRTELSGEVRQHIEMALAEAGRRDEVTVRNVLERLGPPDEIVATEAGSPSSAMRWAGGLAAIPAPRRSPWGAVEIIAILLLTLGSVFLPFVGPLVGLVFVWVSTQWTTRQKLIATVIVAILAILPIILRFGVGAASSARFGS